MLWSRHNSSGCTATLETVPEKTRKLSPREVVTRQIEMLQPEEELVYYLRSILMKPYAVVVRNEDFPMRGRQFTVYQDSHGPDGSPAGRRSRFWSTNKAAEIANWVVAREGKRVTSSVI